MSARLVQPNAYMALASKIDGPGACGMDYPFKIAAFSAGSVGLTSKVTLACPIIPSIDGWLEGTVKPAALLYFGVPLLDIRAGSYACRPRNNLSGAKTSEHAFGNAFDVMAFILADGRQITVVKGWRGEPAEQEFLREVFTGACQTFTTVLGPGSDPFHYDHIHLDLARHDPRGTRRICQPILKFEPRLDPREAARQVQAVSANTIEPLDADDDGPARPDLPRAAQGSYAADLPARGNAPVAPSRPSAQTYRPLATAGGQPGPQPLLLAPQGLY